MRKHSLRYLIIGFQLLSIFSFAQNTVDSGATVNKENGVTTVVIVYILDFLKVGEKTNKTALSEVELENAIAKVFTQTGNVVMARSYPDYILEIVELIPDKKKKEQALDIYNAKNPDKPIKRSSSRSTSMNQGKVTQNMTTLSFTVSVKVKEKTEITIPAYFIKLEGKVFRTKELVVEL